MHFYGFLNMKLKKSCTKIKGRRIRTLPVTMDENWTWSEKLKVRKCFAFEGTLGNFLSFWERKWYKVPNKCLNYLYPLHKTSQKVTKSQSSTTLHIQLSTQVAHPRSRSNHTIHPRALINRSGSSNVRIKSTVLMTPWKHKLRIHSRH